MPDGRQIEGAALLALATFAARRVDAELVPADAENV
jgi:hypothetical protein